MLDSRARTSPTGANTIAEPVFTVIDAALVVVPEIVETVPIVAGVTIGAAAVVVRDPVAS